MLTYRSENCFTPANREGMSTCPSYTRVDLGLLTICRLFLYFGTKRRHNDNKPPITRDTLPRNNKKKMKRQKGDKIQAKDDKYNLLISSLICCLGVFQKN